MENEVISTFSSEMTFGEFVEGIYNKDKFPFDRYLRFSSKTQGDKIGKLIVELLEESSFAYDSTKKYDDSHVSTRVYVSKYHEYSGDDLPDPENTWGWEMVVEFRVFGTRKDRLSAPGIPSRSTIEIECMGYPF